jgi:YesN/AraC family two-component response regulator
MELGCAAFLLKPFSAEQLIEAVAKAIGSQLTEIGFSKCRTGGEKPFS